MPAPVRNRLDNREGAFVVMYNAFDQILAVAGDVPEFELPPEEKGVVI
jgi:hypothetical protein